MWVTVSCTHHPPQQQEFPPGLPLRDVGEIPLPGDNSRFGSASIDASRGLLFTAHLGENEVIQVDVNAGRVVRTIRQLPAVHGVLAVEELGRVYATATRVNEVVAIDESTGQEIGRTPTGDYPDALAFDSRRNAVWVGNVKGQSLTVVDANTLKERGTVVVGGEVGNIVYDQPSDRIVVAVQGTNELAVVDPAAMTVARRVPLPDCEFPHGLAVDEPDRLIFVGCANNAMLLTVDQTSWRIVGTDPVGQGADTLAYDGTMHRLYVAAESGILAVGVLENKSVAVIRSGKLADGAHVVVVDPRSHRTYYPVQTYFPSPGGPNGPVLKVREPT
ncbi:MAG: YncE family protein [Mycobacteriaceae bacterium]|nr:YncE family protein [Mycobacteriaceae bacterium]